LSAAERDFLFYLMDNTIAWGRDSVRTTISQMVSGSPWLPTCGIKRTTLFKIIGHLTECGLIAKAYDGRKTVYTINMKWMPVAMPLATPKRLKSDPAPVAANSDEDLFADDGGEHGTVQITDGESSISELQKSEIRTTYKREAINEGSKDKHAAAPRSDRENEDRLEAPAPISRSSAAEVIASVQAAKPDRKRVPTTWGTWREGWLGTFATTPCPVWTEKDGAIARGLQQRVERAGTDWHDFLHWSVCQWRNVIASKFGWMTRVPPPAYPQIGFLTKFADTFLAAFHEAKDRASTSLDMSMEGQITRMVATGLTRDEALIELGKRKGLSEHRDEVAKANSEAARLLRAAEAAQKRASGQPATAFQPARKRPAPRLIRVNEQPGLDDESW
jgi:hypothetical protein